MVSNNKNVIAMSHLSYSRVRVYALASQLIFEDRFMLE